MPLQQRGDSYEVGGRLDLHSLVLAEFLNMSVFEGGEEAAGARVGACDVVVVVEAAFLVKSEIDAVCLLSYCIQKRGVNDDTT